MNSPIDNGMPANSATTLPELRDFPSPFFLTSGRLRVLEPLDLTTNELYRQLLDGSYGKPFIIEHKQLRYLHFNAHYIQSAMDIDHPNALNLRYTQMMMSFLLFKPSPGTIVMLGLGGGSLAKFCYRELPNAMIAVVEIDPHVITLRRHFSIPDDDDRFRVIRSDAAEFVAHANDQIDILLVDAFDADGLAGSVSEQNFLLMAHAALAATGILVMNLAGDCSSYVELIKQAGEVFNRQILVVYVKEDGNYVLFAFKQRDFEPNWREMKQRAKELKTRHDLDFQAFMQKIAHAALGEPSRLSTKASKGGLCEVGMSELPQ
jgi:spermidine synthase